MASKIESIIAAVETLLTGLATTGANVERSRVYAQHPAKLPALNILFGDDVAAQYLQNSLIDWHLDLIIESYGSKTDDFGEQINDIRKEVHAALLVDYTLGGLLIDIIPISASRPGLIDGEKKIFSQEIVFQLVHRTSRTDINA